MDRVDAQAGKFCFAGRNLVLEKAVPAQRPRQLVLAHGLIRAFSLACHTRPSKIWYLILLRVKHKPYGW